MKYKVRDEQGPVVEIEADCAQDAAQEYVDGGDWGECDGTQWISLTVKHLDDDGEEVSEGVRIAIDPPEPDCIGDNAHLFGLCKVFGNGGGVILNETCVHCGCVRRSNTWAQDPSTGEQGLASTTYSDADPEELESIRQEIGAEMCDDETSSDKALRAAEVMAENNDESLLGAEELAETYRAVFGHAPESETVEVWSELCAAYQAAAEKVTI